MKTSLSPLQKPTHLIHYFFARHSVDCKLFLEGVNISQTRTNPPANKSLQKELANHIVSAELLKQWFYKKLHN